MSAQLIRADARALPLAAGSVDLVVTSPPYFALRSYQDGGGHYAGQIGDEATPRDFVDNLLTVMSECVRVLKPSGSIFVNLGDKYAQVEERSRNGNGNRQAIDNFASGSVLREPTVTLGRKANGVPRKSLIGIPWRFALACIDELGLILRAEIVWSKPNGLPESVTDRVRRSHEQWFHFTVQPRYYSAVDEIREAYTHPPFKGQKRHDAGQSGATRNPVLASLTSWDATGYQGNPLGKLPGSVWTVPTEPLQVPAHLGVDHFAAFPLEFPLRIIRGWSPAGVCVECGEGRRPVVEHAEWWAEHKRRHGLGDYMADGKRDVQELGARRSQTNVAIPQGPKHVIAGYACACADSSAATTPGVVLDPFGGTGTTALAAHALGRTGISVDLSSDYCRLARWRTTDRNELARALRIPKPEPVADGQGELFGAAS